MIIKTNIVNYKYFTNISPSEKIVFSGLSSIIDAPCDCIILMLSNVLTASHVQYLENLYSLVKCNGQVPCYLIGIGCTLKDQDYKKYINKKGIMSLKNVTSLRFSSTPD